MWTQRCGLQGVVGALLAQMRFGDPSFGTFSQVVCRNGAINPTSPTLDPSFAGAQNYHIVVSDGVGNALPCQPCQNPAHSV